MKLEMTKGDGDSDQWIVSVNGKDEVFILDTRGQVYAFIRAARMLGFPDESLNVSRTLKATYSFEGE